MMENEQTDPSEKVGESEDKVAKVKPSSNLPYLLVIIFFALMLLMMSIIVTLATQSPKPSKFDQQFAARIDSFNQKVDNFKKRFPNG